MLLLGQEPKADVLQGVNERLAPEIVRLSHLQSVMPPSPGESLKPGEGGGSVGADHHLRRPLGLLRTQERPLMVSIVPLLQRVSVLPTAAAGAYRAIELYSSGSLFRRLRWVSVTVPTLSCVTSLDGLGAWLLMMYGATTSVTAVLITAIHAL